MGDRRAGRRKRASGVEAERGRGTRKEWEQRASEEVDEEENERGGGDRVCQRTVKDLIK